MTDEEMAEEYCNNEVPFDTTESGEKLYTKNDLKYAYLAGLKAGRPEWHKVADGDLPKENHFVLVLNKQTGYEIARHAPFEEYLLDNWVTIDNRCFTQAKNNPIIIAWCEIPKYTEE